MMSRFEPQVLLVGVFSSLVLAAFIISLVLLYEIVECCIIKRDGDYVKRLK